MNRRERLGALHAEMQANIEQVVRFERYYARRLRATSDVRRPNVTNVSFAQAAIFHELRAAPCPVGWLRTQLGLDPGYLSRSLRWLELAGSVTISIGPRDKRRRLVSLTKMGGHSADYLEREEARRARGALEELPRRQQRRLVRAMAIIVELLERDVLANIVDRERERG